jgi:hypothetical protein
MGILTKWMAKLVDRDNAKLDAAQRHIYPDPRMSDVCDSGGVENDPAVEPITSHYLESGSGPWRQWIT